MTIAEWRARKRIRRTMEPMFPCPKGRGIGGKILCFLGESLCAALMAVLILWMFLQGMVSNLR